MGTWDEGILDNDTAADGLAELQHGVAKDIVAFGAAKPTPIAAAKLGGAVGVLLQLSANEFGLDTDTGKAIVSALKAHATQIAALPVPAKKLLEKVMAGKGKALAERPAVMPAAQITMLHAAATRPPFGLHEPSLFAAAPAAAYVQEVARRCIDAIDEDFEDDENWSDLCREGMGIGTLAALIVLEPCHVPVAAVERWRRCARKGLATLEADADDELEFHKKYYANLDRVFGVLRRRFT